MMPHHSYPGMGQQCSRPCSSSLNLDVVRIPEPVWFTRPTTTSPLPSIVFLCFLSRTTILLYRSCILGRPSNDPPGAFTMVLLNIKLRLLFLNARSSTKLNVKESSSSYEPSFLIWHSYYQTMMRQIHTIQHVKQQHSYLRRLLLVLLFLLLTCSHVEHAVCVELGRPVKFTVCR